MEEFEIGCFVSVKDTQNHYPIYSSWAKAVGATRYKKDSCPTDLSRFKIVAKARHFEDAVTLYLLENNEGQFIFDAEDGKFELLSRFKEAYEKVDDVVSGECLYVNIGDKYSERLVIGNHPHHPCIVVEDGDGNINTLMLSDLYRKVTKPIEWWEDAVEFAQHSEDMASDYNKDSDSIYLNGTFSREEACDFARILLEQGE